MILKAFIRLIGKSLKTFSVVTGVSIAWVQVISLFSYNHMFHILIVIDIFLDYSTPLNNVNTQINGYNIGLRAVRMQSFYYKQIAAR